MLFVSFFFFPFLQLPIQRPGSGVILCHLYHQDQDQVCVFLRGGGVARQNLVLHRPGQSPGRRPAWHPPLQPASVRVPAGRAVACTAVEAVRPGISMSGQQQQSVSGVGRRRRGRNHQEAGSSGHKGEAKFECQLCDKTFKCNKGLRYHTLTHNGVKNYECDLCGKKFTTKSQLTIHILTHTGVRNHECKECGKKFTTRSHLTRHILIHTGARNYECEECEKKFITKCDLTRHTLTHSGVRNYECEECGKRFPTIAVLNRHAFRHTGLREFKCDVCGKCFKTKPDIAKHVKIHF
ncbi:oocyte zinc finger protein XlCOF6.1-like isoform X1 [Scylla paramamosain]|uniref:oocyte zinc finger protein XlCOF6.1-like isoform X1 n=2 Tax=Scylla paramamosain TaxID=85552 RepID=UPI003083816F